MIFSITDAQANGASVLLGGSSCQPNNLPGYFFQPTVLSNMSTKSIITREETFAPVVALYRFKTEEEAVQLANDCDVGLGSFIMTENQARMWRVAEDLEVGMVGVNLGLLSACESPFGGKSLPLARYFFYLLIDPLLDLFFLLCASRHVTDRFIQQV